MGGMLSGGHNNVSFIQNIRSGFVPHSSAINYDSTISKFYFKFSKNQTTKPLESIANYCRCIDPLTGDHEEFLGLSLLCGEDGKNKREDLNLVIVLDISGSMGSKFPSKSKDEGENDQTLIQTAIKCILDLLKILKPNERLGIVLFDDVSVVLQPILTVSEINMDSLRKSLMEVTQRGSTNMEIGFQEALRMVEHQREIDQKYPPGTKLPKNNRIIFMTDAQPNTGGGQEDLYTLSLESSKRKIYSTFLGLGLDFGTVLVNKLTSVRGSNYLSVLNQEEFRRILVEDFNYLVTPLFFNVQVDFFSNQYEIVKTYGPYEEEVPKGPEKAKEEPAPAPTPKNKVIQIPTLMASDVSEKGVKGGIFIMKIKRKDSEEPGSTGNSSILLRYENSEGIHESIEVPLNLFPENKEKLLYESEGIRKGVMLIRYVGLMKEYCSFIMPDEKEKKPIMVADEMKVKVKALKEFMLKENEVLRDESLQEELEVLDLLKFDQNEKK